MMAKRGCWLGADRRGLSGRCVSNLSKPLENEAEMEPDPCLLGRRYGTQAAAQEATREGPQRDF